MVYQLQPVGLFTSEHVYQTLFLFDFDVDQLVGMPDVASSTTVTTPSPNNEKPVDATKPGDCVEVCRTNDCNYLTAIPGLSNNGLTLSEKVAKEILGDMDDYSSQLAAWQPAPKGKCEDSPKVLRKRDWYGPHAQEYGLPNYEYYPNEQEELGLQQELYEPGPSEYYLEEKKEFYPQKDFYEPGPASYYRGGGGKPNPRQTQAGQKNIKITNNNSGNVGSENAAPSGGSKFSALTDPPRRTVGPSTPPAKPNTNKGSTKKFPANLESPSSSPQIQKTVKPGQSSITESYSSDPTISFNSRAHYPQLPEKEPPKAPPATEVAEPKAVSQTPSAEDESSPRMKKIEHPDGSVEYSFGITSGEYNVFNEGDKPVKKPGIRQKSVISSLKSSLGLNDDITRAGWTRRMAKRGLIPENKPTAKNSGQGQHQNPYPNPKGLSFFDAPTAKYQAPSAPRRSTTTPAPKRQQKVQPKPAPAAEKTQEELDAETEQSMLDLQKQEADRMRKMSLKNFYRGSERDGEELELRRDREAEALIKEESDRIAAENAQKRREERARQQKEKKAQMDTREDPKSPKAN